MKNSWLILMLTCLALSGYSQIEPIKETYWTWDEASDHLKQTSRYLHTYNPDGLLIGSVYQIMKNDRWHDEANITYVYNHHHQLITQQFESWINYSWIPTYRNVHFYNDDHLLSEKILQAWEEESWANVSLKRMEINASLNYTKETNQFWSNGQWVNHNQIIDYPDAHGNLKSRLHKRWKEDKWVYEIREMFHYDDNHQVSQLIVENWQTDHWEKQGNYFHYYDDSNNTESTIFYRANPLEEEEDYRWDYEYDEGNHLIKEVFSPGRNELWKPYIQNIHNYDSTGNKISLLSQLWADNWRDQEYIEYDYPSLKDTFLINAVNNLITFPNPATNELHVLLSDQIICPCSVYISGTDGKTSMPNPTITQDQLIIPINNLTPGWYQLQLISKNLISSYPFIKE